MLYNILDIKCKFVYPSNENLGIISIYFFTIIKKDPVWIVTHRDLNMTWPTEKQGAVWKS